MPQFNPHHDQGLFLHYARKFWLNGPRGSGRTTAMAMLAIEKILKGERVSLYDPSEMFANGIEHRNRVGFQRVVQDLLTTYYPDVRVTFNIVQMTAQLDARVPVPPDVRNIPFRAAPLRYNPAPAQARFLAEDGVAQMAWEPYNGRIRPIGPPPVAPWEQDALNAYLRAQPDDREDP